MEPENKDILIRYLLGDLPEQEMERLAEEHFVHDEAWEALNTAESDLIDAYVRGELSRDLQQKFTTRFMNSPRRRERVEFAKILMNSGMREQMGAVRTQGRAWENRQKAGHWMQRPAIKFPLIAAGLLMAGLIAAVAVQNRHLCDELKRTQSAQTELQRQLDIARQQAANHSTAPRDTHVEIPLSQLLSHDIPTISIMLSPGVLRTGHEPPTLPLTAVRSSIVLVLELEQDRYPSYEAVIKTAGGKSIKRIAGLKSQQVQDNEKAIALNIPAQLLKRDDYVVALFGLRASGQAEPVEFYAFSVSR
ncbi:MAG TPA: hypothetical protein VHA33_21020 [Candidatus Angelobacter sp.]|nr:hypothetical protein [Candidatus Angelobacter sp.]